MSFDHLPESATVNLLLELVGRGGSNVSSATQIARAVKADGMSLPAIEAIASCGNYGSSSSNEERDLHRFLRGSRGLKLEPYEITLELQAPLCALCVLLQHSLFNRLFRVGGPRGAKLLAKVDYDDDPVPVQVSTLLPHEVLHALHQLGGDQAA